MDFLQKIASEKHREVEAQKSRVPVSLLEKSEFFTRQPSSLYKALRKADSCGIIAEFKRRSPSAGMINNHSKPQEVCPGYIMAGASAVSVLTDFSYFGGRNTDLSSVREVVDCPVLRKDFVIDEYQLIEARSIGADAVLLIAELHTAAGLERLFRFAVSLGLEALIEVHERTSFSKIPADAPIVGINSRNLSSLDVNCDYASQLASLLPPDVIKVAESGIKSVTDYRRLRHSGFNAFLIGGYFMRADNPAGRCSEFVSDLKEESGRNDKNLIR
jgi:indole-3-glycerol phosphate synthase